MVRKTKKTKKPRKMLRLRDYLLFALAEAGELFEDVAGVGGLVAEGHKQLYGFVPRRYKRSYFLKTVSEMLATGQINKVIKDGQPYFCLTGKGKKGIERDFPIFKIAEKKWDGSWRVVVFDIPEKKKKVRRTLRAKLLELGFGMMQWSVYISPHDIIYDLKEFLDTSGLAEHAFVLESRTLLVKDQKALAMRIWKLDKLNQKYEKLLESVNDSVEKSDIEKKKLYSQYLDILVQDPILPRQLLPKDWMGSKVRTAIKKLLK